MELLEAEFVRHSFPRHSHEFYAFGLVTAGCTTFFARGGHHAAGPGDLLLHDPESIHTGEPGGDDGWQHRMLYVAPSLLAGLTAAGASRGAEALPSFRRPLTADTEFTQQFSSAFTALKRAGHDPLAASEALHILLQQAVRRFASRASTQTATQARPSARALHRVRDRIEADCTDPGRLGLATLAAEAELSSTHLITAFRRLFGLPPAAFALQCRVRHARALLTGTSLPLAAVAAHSGFYDQSDLSRHFVRHHGLPPGLYRRQRRIVQDQDEPLGPHPRVENAGTVNDQHAKGRGKSQC